MSETCRGHLWDKIIIKLFASSWYIFLTYYVHQLVIKGFNIVDARNHEVFFRRVLWRFTAFFINKIFFRSRTRSWWVISWTLEGILLSLPSGVDKKPATVNVSETSDPNYKSMTSHPRKKFDLKLAQTYSRKCTPYRRSKTVYSIYS